MADKKQKVLLKRSSTAGKMPNQISGSTVENGELFMNIASGANAINFLTTLKAGGNSGVTEDYIKWSDDKYNEKKYSPITHNHDDRYYTETEIDGKLIKKSDTGHTHSATAITSGTLDIARIPTGTGSKQVALGNHDHDDVYATIKDVEDNELITSTAINKIIESVGLNEDCSTQFDDGESLTSAINKKVNITDRINSAYTAYSATTVPFTGIPTGTTSSTVAVGNHTHSANAITGTTKLSMNVIPTGTTSSTVAVGNHSHSNYSTTGHKHVASDITGGTLDIARIPTGTTSSTVAVGNHTHSGYLSAETYKGTITGITAGTGLTGGGSASTGSKSVTLSLNTTYQNNIASGASAYTMVNALSGALIDVEYVVAAALNTFNESAGFNEDGTSSLEGGETLSEAIGRLDEKPILRVGAGNVSAITVAVGGNISDNFIVGYATSATTANSATTAKSASTVTVNAGSTRSKYYLAGVTGTGTAYRSLYCRQEVWMTGGLLYASSDERLKNFTDDISVDFDALKKIPKKYFYWKDKDKMGDSRQIGTSAQKLAEIYPDIVNVDEEGNCGVSYERLSIIALAAIDKLNERIEELERKLNEK